MSHLEPVSVKVESERAVLFETLERVEKTKGEQERHRAVCLVGYLDVEKGVVMHGKKEGSALLEQSKVKSGIRCCGASGQSVNSDEQAAQRERQGRVTGLTVDTRGKSSSSSKEVKQQHTCQEPYLRNHFVTPNHCHHPRHPAAAASSPALRASRPTPSSRAWGCRSSSTRRRS